MAGDVLVVVGSGWTAVAVEVVVGLAVVVAAVPAVVAGNVVVAPVAEKTLVPAVVGSTTRAVPVAGSDEAAPARPRTEKATRRAARRSTGGSR